jgi:hypothetical protein
MGAITRSILRVAQDGGGPRPPWNDGAMCQSDAGAGRPLPTTIFKKLWSLDHRNYDRRRCTPHSCQSASAKCVRLATGGAPQMTNVQLGGMLVPGRLSLSLTSIRSEVHDERRTHSPSSSIKCPLFPLHHAQPLFSKASFASTQAYPHAKSLFRPFLSKYASHPPATITFFIRYLIQKQIDSRFVQCVPPIAAKLS